MGSKCTTCLGLEVVWVRHRARWGPMLGTCAQPAVVCMLQSPSLGLVRCAASGAAMSSQLGGALQLVIPVLLQVPSL